MFRHHTAAGPVRVVGVAGETPLFRQERHLCTPCFIFFVSVLLFGVGERLTPFGSFWWVSSFAWHCRSPWLMTGWLYQQ